MHRRVCTATREQPGSLRRDLSDPRGNSDPTPPPALLTDYRDKSSHQASHTKGKEELFKSSSGVSDTRRYAVQVSDTRRGVRDVSRSFVLGFILEFRTPAVSSVQWRVYLENLVHNINDLEAMEERSDDHWYLGGLSNVYVRVPEPLKRNVLYDLPFVYLNDIVLCPGEELPYRPSNEGERRAVQKALQAHGECTGVIVVSRAFSIASEQRYRLERIGCTARVIKMSSDFSKLVVRGFKRVCLKQLDLEAHTVRVEVIDDVSYSVPRQVRESVTFWPLSIFALYDCEVLAENCLRIVRQKMPMIQLRGNSPIFLSYELMSKLPIDRFRRQVLLESCFVSRLQKELKIIQVMDGIYCGFCGHRISRLEDVKSLNFGHFVNPHGVVHDILKVGRADGRTEGIPQYHGSWFSEYTWQYFGCRVCTNHIGWRFRREGEVIDDGSDMFYGLRKDSLSNRTYFNEDEDLNGDEYLNEDGLSLAEADVRDVS
eukprot:jgi/Picsp_1/4823/NSC_02190-R1_myblike dnabinding protein